MKTQDFNLPKFIFGEFPIKDNSFNDQRQFITYKGLSLIEVIAHDEFESFITFPDKISAQFSFFDEDFTLVFHTNNTEYYNENPKNVLKQAWEWYKEYLIWEDTN